MSVKSQEKINTTIGRRLKMGRIWRGLSVDELAIRCDLTAKALEKYECGHGRIDADKVVDIAAILRLPLDFFFEDLCECAADNDCG